MTEDGPAGSGDRRAFWEQHYGAQGRIWSGAANKALVEVASTLHAGSALDLGCGEGGDAIWLTSQGWRVTGVDISETALERARADADAAGLTSGEITWRREDLTVWRPDCRFDLVSACFLQAPDDFDRDAVLARMSTAVDVGGHLLAVSHAAMPPWSKHHHHEDMPTAEQDARTIESAGGTWERVIVEVRTRQATGPDGQEAQLSDNVVLMRRAVTP